MSGISKFQREKLEYYFNFFDSNGDKFLEQEDLPGFMKKILKYTGWDDKSQKARACYEIHATFFEVLKEKTHTQEQEQDQAPKELKVSVTDWLDLWDTLLPGCMGMYHFPVWLRLLPKSLFQIIDKKNDDVIDVEELAEFYENMVHLKPEEAKSLSKQAFDDMTDYGRYPLNEVGYEQIFANFLLSSTPYGPGRYIFGCFESTIKGSHFSLIQPAVAESESEEEEQQLEAPVPPMTEDGRPTFF